MLYQGEGDERSHLDQTFHKVQSVARQLASSIVSLTWVTSGHGWLAMAVPFLIASPGYFSGRLSLGTLMVAVGAMATQLELRMPCWAIRVRSADQSIAELRSTST